jgi:3-hydroxyacyl-CoA dehydrogenase
MTIIEAKEKKDEAMNVNFDRIRRMGSLSGWQRTLYNYIVNRLGATYLQKVINMVYDKQSNVVPEGVDSEDVKDTIKVAFIDYVDSML